MMPPIQRKSRSLPLLFAAAALCGAGTSAQTPAVPGMKLFTDASFGFSCWLPQAWTVTSKPVIPEPKEGWFRGGTVVKHLALSHPAASEANDQPPRVSILEVVAPHGLTELGASRSASPIGVDQRYFFDTRAKRWMYEQLSEGPDGSPPSTKPAQVEQTTMGGLPVLPGAERFGAEVIVPLDDSHFLAIATMDPGGERYHLPLAATVVAARRAAGKPASQPVQLETIRREAVALGVVAKP